MNSPELVVKALKSLLKMRGHTYSSLAAVIGLSESSVKRLFAERTFTLTRLLQICDVLQVELADIVNLMGEDYSSLPSQLTVAQEEELAAAPKLFAVFYLATKQWSFSEMLRRLSISEMELNRLFLRLDKMELIEFDAGHRFRLQISRDFKFRKGGPLAKIYRSAVRGDFLKGEFDSVDEQELFLIGEVSKDSWTNILKRIEALSGEIRSLMLSDALLPKKKTMSVGMMFLSKPWTYIPVFGKSDNT
jgi:DNA-binding Xre family transcriptional regulator